MNLSAHFYSIKLTDSNLYWIHTQSAVDNTSDLFQLFHPLSDKILRLKQALSLEILHIQLERR